MSKKKSPFEGALVIKEKQINPEGPLYVKIVGRKAGLLAYLLTLIGFLSTTIIEVYADRVVYTKKTVTSRFSKITPMQKLSDIYFGHTRSLLWLVLATLFAIMSITMFNENETGAAIFYFFVAIVFVIVYFLKKFVTLAFVSDASLEMGILLKSSAASVCLSEKEMEAIIDIITDLTNKANK
jgi:hypothetical protein